MRSLRSGTICQALLTSISRYGIIKDTIRQAIKRHVGWNNDESIDAYERMSIFCFQNIASLQDLEQNAEANNLVRQFIDEMDPKPQSKTPTPVRMKMRQVRRSVSHPKKSPCSVVKRASFRGQLKAKILEMRPLLKEACFNEPKGLDGKDHQVTWMKYHHKYIKKWCETSVECQPMLEQNNEYQKGNPDTRQSILLNIGKTMFMKLATGDKIEEYINKVFYEDWQHTVRKEDNDDEEQPKINRFFQRRVKRKLFDDEIITQPDVVLHGAPNSTNHEPNSNSQHDDESDKQGTVSAQDDTSDPEGEMSDIILSGEEESCDEANTGFMTDALFDSEEEHSLHFSEIEESTAPTAHIHHSQMQLENREQQAERKMDETGMDDDTIQFYLTLQFD